MAVINPLGIKGQSEKITKKRLTDLNARNIHHVITGYAPTFYDVKKGKYYSHSDKDFGEKTTAQLWTHLKDTCLVKHACILWQEPEIQKVGD